MRIATISLLAATAALAAACTAQPGSAEWCKGVMEGKIQASDADKEKYSMQCVASMMKESLGDMKLPGQ